MITAERADQLAADYIDAVNAGDKKLGLRARLHDELDTYDTARRNRLDAPAALKAAALWYAQNGVPVFPLKPRDKRPATRNGFKDATTDLAVINTWWNTTPDANIGAPTGGLFDVVDIDGPTGVHTWVNTPALFDELAQTRIGHVTTSRPGGHHIYLKAVPGRGNKAGMFPGIDYRGAGGYVVIPPSVGANGVRYAWLYPLALA